MPPTLPDFYRSLALPDEAWHLGPEHPSLENLALSILQQGSGCRVLEVGVQSGGFAVPVIMGMGSKPGFEYTGIDNLEYTNAVRLHLIESYLRTVGVGCPLNFLEGDSTSELRRAAPRSFDFILLDHYKPKYPIDLHVICSRNLLSETGTIVLHDVLAHAAADWRVCEYVCDAFGYSWIIDSSVYNGAAIVRRVTRRQDSVRRVLVGAFVASRWHAHATMVSARRAAGFVLSRAGLRR